MNTEEIKQGLKKEGFPFVYEWIDEPRKIYAVHHHQDRVVVYILKGEVVFDFSGTKKKVIAGERIDIPPKTDHRGIVGPEGVSMVYGEMIEGDA